MENHEFRAWDKQNKVMHYDFQFIKSGEEGNDWIIFISDKQKLFPQEVANQLHPLNNPYLQQQFDIMQCIGYFGGSRIFEGDIIKVKYEDLLGIEREAIGIVVIGDLQVMLDFPDDGIVVPMLHFYTDKPDDFEILGNTYETPELLKAKEIASHTQSVVDVYKDWMKSVLSSNSQHSIITITAISSVDKCIEVEDEQHKKIQLSVDRKSLENLKVGDKLRLKNIHWEMDQQFVVQATDIFSNITFSFTDV